MNGPERDKPDGGRATVLAALAALAALIGGLLMFRTRSHGSEPPRAPRSAPAPEPEEESVVEGHELTDMRTKQVVYWLALLTVAVTALVIGVTIFEVRMIGHAGPLVPVVDDPPRVTPPPQPRLEKANGEVLAAQHAKENEILNNYTWVDQGAGVVSIPIDRAIELTVERGLPVRQGTDGEQEPGLTLPQGSSSGRTLERIP
jgi:hypothetical protein